MVVYSASLEDVKTAVLGLLVILQVGLCISLECCSLGTHPRGDLGTPWGLRGQSECDPNSSLQWGDQVRALTRSGKRGQGPARASLWETLPSQCQNHPLRSPHSQ